MICNKIGAGAFGSVYSCKDLENPRERLVMKISSNRGIAENEVTAIESIKKTARDNMQINFPQIICKGFFSTGSEEDLDYEKHYMFIMKEFGMTIEDYQLMSETGHFGVGLNFGVQVAIQLLELLECVHESGYVYNDLKTDNLMIGMSDKNKCSNLKLIDFGLANRYIDKDNEHIPP